MSILVEERKENKTLGPGSKFNDIPDIFTGCSCSYFYPNGQFPVTLLNSIKATFNSRYDKYYELKDDELDFTITGSPVYGGTDGVRNFKFCSDKTVEIKNAKWNFVSTECSKYDSTGRVFINRSKLAGNSDKECDIPHGCSSQCKDSGQCKQFDRGMTENIVDISEVGDRNIFIAKPGNMPKNLQGIDAKATKSYGSIAEKEYKVNTGVNWERRPFEIVSVQPAVNQNKTVYLGAQIIVNKLFLNTTLLNLYKNGYNLGLETTYVQFKDNKGKNFIFEIESYIKDVMFPELLGNIPAPLQPIEVLGNTTIFRDITPDGISSGAPFITFTLGHSYEIEPDTIINIRANTYKSRTKITNRYGPFILSRAWVR